MINKLKNILRSALPTSVKVFIQKAMPVKGLLK